ncbi:MAG: asparagine synthase (glutamine-hydrolyzing) [Deltaproteobacteria bacterium]|nr:asparagine synthase (glutamine-hydrolyzing) [Deltaproteobacteria bacterium]
MCGIAGIIGDFAEEQVASALGRMLGAQIHRGPDDEGMEVLRAGASVVGLGNRRLAVVDTSPLGHQPMANPDTGDVLVYNGELYNAPELRESLKKSGYGFRGQCDTEVLLRAYEHWGIQCLSLLKGMFAFGLWDARGRRLLLARDHLGIKPLYYAGVLGTGLLFASEVRALLASGFFSAEIDKRALASYLAYGAAQEPLSIIQDIFTVPPGSLLTLNSSGQIIARETYWEIPSPELDGRQSASRGLVDEGRALLESSVRRHLLSDVPLGVFLSSGLDSTAVLGMARKVASERIQAFTVSFPDNPDYSEGALAREAARRLDVAHHDCLVDSGTTLKWVEDGLARMDQPALDGLNTYMVSRAVREQGIVVALSGQGGDELFGGYRSFRGVPQWHSHMGWLRSFPPSLRAGLIQLATTGRSSAFREKAQDVARAGPDLLSLYFHFRRVLSDGDMTRLGVIPSNLELSPSFHYQSGDDGRYLIFGDPISTVRRLETVFYLRNTLLRDGDVFGMANSLEIRVPLLDRDLVEWAFRVPSALFLPQGAPGKHLLREMCAEFYDAKQTKQPKRGFMLPLQTWLIGPLRELMEDCLVEVKRSGMVEPAGVDHVRAVFLREPQSTVWSRVWVLVTLGFWLANGKWQIAGSMEQGAWSREQGAARGGWRRGAKR